MDKAFLRPGTPGRSVTVFTRWGRETYQVWLDEKPPGWMARIVTLPDRIWALPGGREVLKLYGSTSEEAEAAAMRFIEAECLQTGRRIASPWQSEAFRDAGKRAGMQDGSPAPRMARRLLVRFGSEQPERPGVTANLSETGMFIVTDRPAPVGAPVRIDLRFPECQLALDGLVIWAREKRDEGRSLGFGVRLTNRPPEYLHRVRSLREVSPDNH